MRVDVSGVGKLDWGWCGKGEVKCYAKGEGVNEAVADVRVVLVKGAKHKWINRENYQMA